MAESLVSTPAKANIVCEPSPVIRERPINSQVLEYFRSQGVELWFAEILSRRLDSAVPIEEVLNPSLGQIDDPSKIADMDRAVERIVRAIARQERIVFACDHDMDGTASAAVLWLAFTQYFGVSSDLLSVVTSHRLNEGYGITEPVVRRILEIKPELVISADKGSSDEPRIRTLAAAKIDVVVTDHHTIPTEGPPKSAFAVVSPTRSDSHYDANICGAAVAFLTMAKVRTALLRDFPTREIQSLSGLIDIVAAATIADCVAMRPDKSFTNRVFVKKGLELLNKQVRPCWRAFCESLHGPVDAESVAFRLVPAIAAAGRLDWAEAGFRFLTADSISEARKQWSILQAENTERKKLEATIRKRAFAEAMQIEGQSLVVFLSDGHSGVHGISASRLVEAFGKPAAIFAIKGVGARDKSGAETGASSHEIASGSFRSIPGLNVRDALEFVSVKHPALLRSWGGHPAAAGASLLVDDLPLFRVAFEEAVVAQIGSAPLRPAVWIDGAWPEDLLNLNTLDQLSSLDPWGKDFPLPILKGEFEFLSIRAIGDGTHYKCAVRMRNLVLDAIWFGAVKSPADAFPIEVGSRVSVLYRIKANWFKNVRSLQLEILMQCPEGDAQ
jgi:single-stranded-DNA-specific exonuclease